MRISAVRLLVVGDWKSWIPAYDVQVKEGTHAPNCGRNLFSEG